MSPPRTQAPPGGNRGAKLANRRTAANGNDTRRRLVILGPPHPHRWLTDLPDGWRHFCVEVVHADLPDTEKLELARLFRDRWGTGELAAALRFANRHCPLGGAMLNLLRTLTRVAA